MSPPPNTERLTSDDVLSLVETLPPWQRDLDDDPVWVRSVRSAGFTEIDIATMTETERATLLEARTRASRALPSARSIPTHAIEYAAQPWLRLDALAYYIRQARAADAPAYSTLFDRDGWFGNQHPVLVHVRGAFCVLDGTHRCAASKVTRQPLTTAHVIAV